MKYSRTSFITLASVLLAASPATAQTVLGPNGPVNPERQQSSGHEPGEPYVYRLTVTPAPEPNPPLKYSLYPRWDELEPGNSVPYWYRALKETSQNSPHMVPLSENYDQWFTEPWSDLPVDEIRPFLQNRSTSLNDARTAAYREEADWDLGLRRLRGEEAIQFQLGEFQDARTLARILSLRIRLNLLDGNFEAALADMTVCFRLAHDVAEPATLINDLIGFGIMGITQVNVRHMIDVPGSPNLYWALAEIPSPLIDLRAAAQQDMTLPERYFPWLKDPAAEERSIEQWHDLLHETVRQVAAFDSDWPSSGDSDPAIDVALLGFALKGYPTVKRDLAANGYTLEEVESMPAGKAIALHQRFVYQLLSQNFAAPMFLPYRQAQRQFEEIEQEMEDWGYHQSPWQGRETIPIASELLPALQRVQMAQIRRQVMTAALMTVEAIRMHLAESGGKLPQSLDEITVVPVPDNPWLDAPFVYHLQEDVAVLDFLLPHFHQQFEIRVDTDGAPAD